MPRTKKAASRSSNATDKTSATSHAPSQKTMKSMKGKATVKVAAPATPQRRKIGTVVLREIKKF